MSPVYVNDILKDIFTKTDAALFPTLAVHIQFMRGPEILISKKLKDLTLASQTKYPFLAIIQPYDIFRGGKYYGDVMLPRIVIGTVTNSTDEPEDRDAITFKPVLYPIYYEFLTQLARHASNAGSSDPDSISHRLTEIPGTQPATTDIKDFLDTIEMYNTKITIKQFC